MISTISKRGGRRYTHMGSTWSTFVGRLLGVGTSGGGPATNLVAMESMVWRRFFSRIWGRVN